MHEPRPIANPFELMMNPEAVLQAMARSDRLERLQRRICRPLDKPTPLQQQAKSEASDDDQSESGTTDADGDANQS